MNKEGDDSFWEERIYSRGQNLNRYPFDIVVSFVYGWYPRNKPRDEVRILELGSGAGNNLWFAAREGFQVAGIDGSSSAIEFARSRFGEDGLSGEFCVGNFVKLPWAEDAFDLVIDRGSLTCSNLADQHLAVREVNRVLRPGGVFFYNGYSDQHTSARAGTVMVDGRMGGFKRGTMVGVDGLYFTSKRDVGALFSEGWNVQKKEHLLLEDLTPNGTGIHAEWRIIAQKIPNKNVECRTRLESACKE